MGKKKEAPGKRGRPPGKRAGRGKRAVCRAFFRRTPRGRMLRDLKALRREYRKRADDFRGKAAEAEADGWTDLAWAYLGEEETCREVAEDLKDILDTYRIF